MELNEKLKLLRLESGLTQAQLAEKLNIGQTTIAAYENGVHEPQMFSLIAYANYFGCTVDYLVATTTNEDMIIEENLPESVVKSEDFALVRKISQLQPKARKLVVDYIEMISKSDINKK